MHVDIRGDNALATTHHTQTEPDEKKGQTITTYHETVWHLRRIQGNWRITSLIWGVARRQEVFIWGPTLRGEPKEGY